MVHGQLKLDSQLKPSTHPLNITTSHTWNMTSIAKIPIYGT